jgi:hypothetical protein
MTVKELKKILETIDEDTKVMLINHEGYFIEVEEILKGVDLSSGEIVIID